MDKVYYLILRRDNGQRAFINGNGCVRSTAQPEFITLNGATSAATELSKRFTRVNATIEIKAIVDVRDRLRLDGSMSVTTPVANELSFE